MLAEKRWSTILYEPAAYILKIGGKRVRPLLAMLAYQAVSGKSGKDALNLAVAVEMFHNFTLVHDDIMDAAPLRRGQPTVHQKWNVNTAILSGDAMFALSAELATRDFPQHAAALIREFSAMAASVCEGQAEDMALQGDLEVELSAYLQMIEKKTALLIGSSLCMGAIAAGAHESICNAFLRWGIAEGLGFQLRDDYLDAFGDVSKIGKQPGGDILQNKMTYLLLKAWARANESQKIQLRELLFNPANSATKVSGTLNLFATLSVQQETQQEMDRQFAIAAQAGAELAHLPGAALISELFTQLKTRES